MLSLSSMRSYCPDTSNQVVGSQIVETDGLRLYLECKVSFIEDLSQDVQNLWLHMIIDNRLGINKLHIPGETNQQKNNKETKQTNKKQEITWKLEKN